MKGRNKVNVKARIKRHVRILRQNLKSKPKQKNFSYSMGFVLFFVVFLMPIYPALATIFYNNSESDFYRWDIDQTSIIDYYYAREDLSDNKKSYVNWNIDAFVSVDTILQWNRDTSWSNEVVNYTVWDWESFESIASDFGISKNTILWANNFSSRHMLHPWDVIKVPPVSWLVYKVSKWDTLESIAKKYSIDIKKIESQNSITRNDLITLWQELIIPWAKKIEPKKPKPVIKPSKTYTKSNTRKPSSSKKWWYSFASKDKWSKISAQKWSYKLVWRKTNRRFAWWNCTYFVSHYKDVTWRWNANQWIRNARAKWVPTGNVAKPWAIVQFTGRWYNPRYGHVWIVTEVSWKHMIVADMNYRRLNEVTYRKVPLNHSAIDWYIYAK